MALRCYIKDGEQIEVVESTVLNRFGIIFLTLFAIFLTVAAHGKNESGQMNSILASVNGEAITLVDILPLTRSKEMQARSVYSGERLEKTIAEYRKAMVNELIDSLLIQAEFNKSNFVLSNQEIEREVDEFAIRVGCRSREQLERKLRKDGVTMDEVRMGICKNMMVQLMLYRQIKIADPISPRELYEYYRNNPDKFSLPHRITLGMLKLAPGSENIDKIGEILKQDPGQFAFLANKYAPEFADGELGEIDVKQLRPEFAAAFQNDFAVGKVVGPLKEADGVLFLKVADSKPAESLTFQNVEEDIRLELERERREKIVNDYTAKLRKKAVVEYYF